MPEQETPYVLTKSGEEADRLNLQHWLLKKYLAPRIKSVADGNVFAPVKHPRAILDVACGTGIWGREVARHFQQAHVENVDLDRKWLDQAQMNLKRGTLPRNFHFTQANILEGLPYPEGTFNYVHARFLSTFVHIDRWPGLVREMVRVLHTGGWLGLIDADLPTGGGPAYQARLNPGRQFLLQRLGSLEAPRRLAEWLAEAGLHSIESHVLPLSIPADEPLLRQALVEDTMKSLRGVAPLLAEAGLLTPAQQRERDLPVVQRELEATGVETTIYIAFGRKPRQIDG